MYFDSLTLAAVAEELRTTVTGARIQRVVLPGELSVGLELYHRGRRHYLIASAHPQYARVHLVPAKLTRGVNTETPLLLLLRKYVLGGYLVDIQQPDLERVLLLSIVKEPPRRNREPDQLDELPDEPGDHQLADPGAYPEDWLRCELVIEPQDRRSNIILVGDNNLVLESVKRVSARMSRRVVMPREPYELPPVPHRRDPRAATADGLRSLLASGERSLQRALVAAYRGVSPLAAREAIYRATGQVDPPMAEDLPWFSLAAHLRGLFTAPPEPSVQPGPDGPELVAPYQLTHLAGSQPVESISAALAACYARFEQISAHAQRRAALRQGLEAARARSLRVAADLRGELAGAEAMERLRWEGEMIFAFLHTLQPGQSVLEVDGRRITLEPGRSPVEEGQARFKAYDKARGALAGVPARLAEVERRIAAIDEQLALLALAEGYDALMQIGAESEELGLLERDRGGAAAAPKRTGARRLRPLHLVSSDGFDIYVGRSATQNAEVTFTIGRPDDLWLHVRAIPGAHVIIQRGGALVPERTITEAAALAAYFSGARQEPLVEVEISRRALVRKIPGAHPSLVTYRPERSVRVAPRPPTESPGGGQPRRPPPGDSNRLRTDRGVDAADDPAVPDITHAATDSGEDGDTDDDDEK